MKVVTWNVNKANEKRGTWDYLHKQDPDIALLQEVTDIPAKIQGYYDFEEEFTINKVDGSQQAFKTAILVKKNGVRFIKKLQFSTNVNWIDEELKRFDGHIFGHEVEVAGNKKINVVSVYSPYWSLDSLWKNVGGRPRHAETIKLNGSKKLWVTDLLWQGLINTMRPNEPWIVGGDFNNSETFDPSWQDEHPEEVKKWGSKNPLRTGGNKEIIDRMNNLGLKECLRESNNGVIVPTYTKTYKGRVCRLHQMDHLYVTNDLFKNLKDSAKVGDRVFERSLSDHLPIIADFR